MRPVHFLHKHFLFSGCCMLILSVSASHAPTTVHTFCPSSPCSLFAKVTVSTLVWGLGDCQPWRTQRSSTALSALHSPWWLIYTSLQLPMSLLFTTLFAILCVVRGQSWLLRIWAHQYTHHLLSLCNVLNINTMCSLRNDKQQQTNTPEKTCLGEFVIPAGNYVACMVNATCLLFRTHFFHKLTHAFLVLHTSWLWRLLIFLFNPLKTHAFKVITDQMCKCDILANIVCRFRFKIFSNEDSQLLSQLIVPIKNKIHWFCVLCVIKTFTQLFIHY